MPGANYISQAQSQLDKLMNQPMPGAYSQGQDQLSSQYEEGVQTGIADLARRGITQSGATPSLFTGLAEAYGTGTTGNIAQAQMAQNQQKISYLQSLLGIGQNAVQQARSGALSSLFTQDIASGLLEGLFGKARGPQGTGGGYLSSGGIPGMLSWLGIGP